MLYHVFRTKQRFFCNNKIKIFVKPNFSPTDVNNIWEIAGEFPELGGNITGSQVLYGERKWNEIATTFVSDGAV